MLRCFLRKVAYSVTVLFLIHTGIGVSYAAEYSNKQEQPTQAEIEKLKSLENRVEQISAAIEKVVLEEEAKDFQNANPQLVLDGNINIYLKQATFNDVLKTIAPTDWNVVVDIKNNEIFENRYMFISTSSRRESLFQFLNDVARTVPGIKLQSKWFFDLKDENGYSSPTLLVFEKK